MSASENAEPPEAEQPPGTAAAPANAVATGSRDGSSVGDSLRRRRTNAREEEASQDSEEASQEGGDSSPSGEEADEENKAEGPPRKEEPQIDHGAHVKQSLGSYAFVFSYASPVLNAAGKCIPERVKRPLIAGFHWMITHKKVMTVVVAVVFTLSLLLVPDTYLPQRETKEVAEIITEAYCNRSVMTKLHDARFDTFGSILGQELPALNTKYLQGLANFACHLPKKEHLVVWAPPGYGTNKGLHQMTLVWKEQGRVVVHINLEEYKGGKNEMVRIIQLAVVEAFQDHDLSGETMRGLDSLLQQASGEEELKSGVASWFTLVQQVTMKLVSAVPLVSAVLQDKLSAFYNSKLTNFNTFLNSLVESDEGALEGINFKTVFSAMDILASYQPLLAPIIVFDHLDALSKLNDVQEIAFVNNLFALLNEHGQEENVVPVVLATRDTLWFYNTNVFTKPELFIPYRVTEMSEEELAAVLVDRLKIWTREEFKKVYAAVGGHVRSIAEIFKYSTFFSQSIDAAIASEAGFSRTTLASTLSQVKGQRGEINKFLSRLRASSYDLVLASLKDVTPAIEPLLQSGVLYVDGFRIRPVTIDMQRALESFISQS